MGVWKINPHDLSSLKTAPKELSQFWRSYFSNLSIQISKMMFQNLGKRGSVYFISRDIVRGKDYFETVSGHCIIQPFTILPHGEIGFVHLSDDLSNFLINYLQGGEGKDPDFEHEISVTDQHLLAPLIVQFLQIIEDQFQSDQIELHPLEEDNILLYANSLQSEQLISTQIFSFEISGHVFTLTIAMGNRMLEQFISV